ncbi:MAG: branched-chain amino acid transaminase [Cyclobacteriaceae bacterium]|nr:branched-chain amino acid transaminase [Cyclobacteriaceae bacterium]
MYFTDNTQLYHNGKFVKAKEASTDLYSQTLHYGYGVFEGIRAYKTVNGVKIFKAHEHFERLLRSCELTGIPFHHSPEELTQISYQVLEKNNLKDAYIRPLVYCHPNMTLSAPTGVSFMIAAWEWGKYHGHQSLKVSVSSFQRPNPKSVKMEAKVCGYYVNSIMATNEAKQRGFDEALMLDINGFVAEGPGANFFYEKDGVLYTPPLGSILPGITRQTVLEICREMDMPVEEKLFRVEDLYEADSAFFCGTAAEIVSIESIEGQPFNKPWKQSMGTVVQEAYKCIVLDKSYSYVIV